MKTKTLLIPILLALFLLNFHSCSKPKSPSPDDYNSQILLSWNELVFKTAIAEDGLMTLKGVRTAAMMHTAVHDALNSIYPLYERYGFKENAHWLNPEIIASQAAYQVARAQYPDQGPVFKQELDKVLSQVEDSQEKIDAIYIAEAVARAVLNKRSNDKWNGEASYDFHPMAPGVYAEFNEHSGTPEGFIFGAGWAQSEPFLLDSPDHFRSPPPPDIKSEAYTKAFEEVKSFGSHQSEVRTVDQAHLAMWWKDFVENSHNRLARDLVAKEKLNLWEGARLFALLNMTVYDAYVNVFDNKFHYNHWRPYTAIRWAANDENPDTEADTQWNNLHKHTYAFPSYPSAHGTASSAAMTVLAYTLGKGNEYSFSMRTDSVDKAGPFSGKVAMNPPARSFEKFTDAGLEASMSRVYLGIHFRYDSEEGHALGNKIGTYACDNFLLKIE
ncbi:MAG: vanadium-dependent haloperoxidase [Bacteroidota bacterium]